MHTWVRRGLRTAFVTGGLLMLGTGIASANENVNPDLPPSSVDAGVSVPVNAGHTPLGTAMHHDVAKAAGKKVAAPALPAALPARPVVSRANPLVRQAQPYARQITTQHVAGRPMDARGDTLSGVLAPVQMAFPQRTADHAVTGLGAARAEPAGWTRGPLRANSTTSSNGSTRTDVTAKDKSVVHNGSSAVPDSATLPGRVSRTVTNSPTAQRLPSVPQNGVLPGVPVVPSIPGVGLFDQPQAQSAPAPLGALPSAPTASVRNVVSGVSSRLPVAYGAEAPTSTVPTTQDASPQILDHSPLSSLPGGLSLGRVVPQAQAEAPTSSVQSLDTRSVELPSNSALPSAPVVGQVEDRASSVPVTDAAGLPSELVRSLEASSVDQLPDVPTVPTAPKVSPAPTLRDVRTNASHVQVHPAEAPTSVERPVQALSKSPIGKSPLGARPGVPEVPSVPDVSSAPTAQSVMATVPVTQAAVVPSTASSTTAVPSPIAELVQPLGTSTIGALPGVPMSDDGFGSLLSQLPVSRLTEAPTSAQPGTTQSPLPTVPLVSGLLGGLPGKASSSLPAVQAAEVPTSVPSVPSVDQATGALPGVPNLAAAQGVLDEVTETVPLLQAAVEPVSAMSSSALTSQTEQGVWSAGHTARGLVPGFSPSAAADSMPQVTGVPSSVENSVNQSPLGSVPVVPTNGVPFSDVDTSSLPSAPVGSVTNSPTGTMFGVPTVRAAGTRSLAAVPVEQLAQVPDTVSQSVNDSPFSSLPGDPTVPSVSSAPDLAVRTSSHPPVSYVTGAPSSAAHATQVFGRPSNLLPGVSDVDGIAGVLPVVQDLFPRI